MPLFGPPYDDDNERRRLMAEEAMAAGAFPRDNAPRPPTLPTLPAPRRPPIPRLPRGVPRGIPSQMPAAPTGPNYPVPHLPNLPAQSPMAAPAPPLPPMPPGAPITRPTRTEELEDKRTAYQAGTPTRGRSALRGAFEGLAAGGPLGAIVGGIYGAADPGGLRRGRFEREEKPRLMEGWQLEDAERQRQYTEQLQQGQLAEIPRRAELHQAQIRHMGTQDEVARSNAARQAALAEADIELKKAQAEAARTGKPVYKDIVQNGEIVTVAVFPGGATQVVGQSGPAAVSAARNQSAERRVATQQAGATARTAERIAAQGETAAGASKLRPPKSGGGGGKTYSGAEVDAKARKKGVDPAAFRAHLKSQGHTIKD